MGFLDRLLGRQNDRAKPACLVVFFDDDIKFDTHELSQFLPTLLKPHDLDVEKLKAAGCPVRIAKLKDFSRTLTPAEVLPDDFIADFTKQNIAAYGQLAVRQIPVGPMPNIDFAGAVIVIWQGARSPIVVAKERIVWFGIPAAEISSFFANQFLA